MKKIALFGATGNIGSQVLNQLEFFQDEYQLEAISFFQNYNQFVKIINRYQSIKYVIAPDLINFKKLNQKYTQLKVFANFTDFFDFLKINGFTYNLIVNAITSYLGYLVSYHSVFVSKKLLLANKESLVMAGDFIMAAAKMNHCEILPVDSEHFGLYSLLKSFSLTWKQLLITCSGGSTYKFCKQNLINLSKSDILTHPNWVMGAAITLNSATLMNKCFEMIEAKHLFNLKINEINAILHPQSLVHSIVLLKDNSYILQASVASMKHVINYYLNDCKINEKFNNNFSIIDQKLEFFPMNKHPLYENFLFYQDIYNSNLLAILLNVINDHFVLLFLNDKINFYQLVNQIKDKFLISQKKFSSYELNSLSDIDFLVRKLSNYLNNHGR